MTPMRCNVWLIIGVALWSGVAVEAGSTKPYYRRRHSVPRAGDGSALKEADFKLGGGAIDLGSVHMPSYPPESVGLADYNRLFDARGAAAIYTAVAGILPWGQHRGEEFGDATNDLLEWHRAMYGAPLFYTLRPQSLAAIAYADYFPDSTRTNLHDMVSNAIVAASPGWCGTFGPGIDDTADVLGATGKKSEGNYDMAQMHMLPLAYGYYDDLSAAAQDRLVTQLLARGRVHRPNRPESFTSGGTPDDWSWAGYISPVPGSHKDILETENHVLMILTARYLTNQLAYQRIRSQDFDNRRNGGPQNQTTDVILSLLRNILRGDFSEYNAKNYQQETRWALLNLSTFAYDAEVRLAARMVLDYVSARFALTSNDLRRMLPFRRRDEYPHVAFLGEWHGPDECPRPPLPTAPHDGIMDIGLLDWQLGADPLTRFFALQAGNTRAFEAPNRTLLPPDKNNRCQMPEVRPSPWAIADGGHEVVIEGLTDYRLPPSIHDLLVNDKHRRFYQRLHRSPHEDEVGGNRNCNHDEITAGSPSYLITSGGRPCNYALDPRFAAIVWNPSSNQQQKGISVTTSFMPTGASAGFPIQQSRDLIQFSAASDNPEVVENYGVAPDLAFGFQVYLPRWVKDSASVPEPYGDGHFVFVDKRPRGERASSEPGFYLAIYQENEFGLLEAFDTWLDPAVSFTQFRQHVLDKNHGMKLKNNVDTTYTTYNGNRVRLVVWTNEERENVKIGANVLGIEYPPARRVDRPRCDLVGSLEGVDLPLAARSTGFLNGTVMNSPAEAVVEISNPFLCTKIVLDMSDPKNPKRTSEDGEVEEAGKNHEVWVDFDFDWPGRKEGDFYRPFDTLEAAVAAVADGGVIRIVPGSTRQAVSIRTNKHIKLVAPIGGVRTGVR